MTAWTCPRCETDHKSGSPADGCPDCGYQPELCCRICDRRPATERVVFEGRNALGNVERIAHAVCDPCVDAYLATVREFGWTIVGLTDIDYGPLGSSLRWTA